MNIRESIRTLQGYNDVHVTELTSLIEAIEEALTDKTISEPQFADLMVDVERLRKIIQEAEDLALNQVIHDSVMGLIALAKALKP